MKVEEIMANSLMINFVINFRKQLRQARIDMPKTIENFDKLMRISEVENDLAILYDKWNNK